MEDSFKSEKSLSFKELKKELKHALYEVEVALKSGEIGVVKEKFTHFSNLNRKFEEQSETEWQANIKDQKRIIRNLEASLKAEDRDSAILLLEKLWKYKKSCHRRFKD